MFNFSETHYNNRTSKISLQYDLNNNLIQEWPSAKEASRKLKINYSYLIQCLKGKIPKAGGFKWKYK